jgi:hypothetical protein
MATVCSPYTKDCLDGVGIYFNHFGILSRFVQLSLKPQKFVRAFVVVVVVVAVVVVDDDDDDDDDAFVVVYRKLKTKPPQCHNIHNEFYENRLIMKFTRQASTQSVMML